MSSEIIPNVVYDNYDDVQHVNFIFSQKFISLVRGLFNDEIELRVRYFDFKQRFKLWNTYIFNQNIERLSAIWVAFNGYIYSPLRFIYIWIQGPKF